MHSTKHVSGQQFAIALFNGFTGTRPTHEEGGGCAGRIAEIIAPNHGPQVIYEKERGWYFVPCVLADAPLIGKTLEWAIKNGRPTTGKMRSGTHVTAGGWIKLDGDGLTDRQFASVQAKLNAAGAAHLIYSTHSHGREDKPGIRCRIILFLDRAMESVEYQQATLACSTWLLGQSLDPSEARLCQQAGVWMAHPDRIAQAFCIRRLDGLCLSANALLAAAPKRQKSRLVLVHSASKTPLPVDAARVNAALTWVDATAYSAWVNVALWLKAAHGEAAYSVWLKWSQAAEEAHRADEGECLRVWQQLQPRIGAEAGAGALFAAARDGALTIARDAGVSGRWDMRATSALGYLRSYHRALYNANFATEREGCA